jgi:two-component system sensor histidine kinase KdpD
LILAATSLAVATVVLARLRTHAALPTDLAVYLLIVVVTSVVGGFWAALPAALAGGLLLNYFFTPPLHTFAISDHDNLVAVVVFVLVAVIVSGVVDKSARRRAEAGQASREAAELAAADSVRTVLLNAVSHDLRTPIASAKAAVSGLLTSDVTWSDDERAELLTSADASLDRLTDLVTNLLDLSRLQAGVLPVLLEPVPLDGVVQRALDHAAPPQAVVETDVPADLPEVLVDAGLLERVVANLVQNAVRYAPDGTPVRVTAAAAGDLVELRVVDRGPGIAPSDAEAVFAPFQHRDDTRAEAGVGLGLAIVRGFAQAMGGEVRAGATPGGGTTMTVRLKAAP